MLQAIERNLNVYSVARLTTLIALYEHQQDPEKAGMLKDELIRPTGKIYA